MTVTAHIPSPRRGTPLHAAIGALVAVTYVPGQTEASVGRYRIAVMVAGTGDGIGAVEATAAAIIAVADSAPRVRRGRRRPDLFVPGRRSAPDVHDPGTAHIVRVVFACVANGDTETAVDVILGTIGDDPDERGSAVVRLLGQAIRTARDLAGLDPLTDPRDDDDVHGGLGVWP